MTTEEQWALRIEMFQYAQQLGQEKRKNPRDDVWSILCNVEVETDEGERAQLGEAELDMFFLLLTVAGSETTRNAIALGLLALLDHPQQLELLRRDESVMGTAVEEIIRWSSPVSYFARRATRDTEIRGVPIREGERITLWYPSRESGRRGLRGSLPLRYPPRLEPPRGFRWWRPAFLPRREPRAAGDRDPLRDAARAGSRDRGAGRAEP